MKEQLRSGAARSEAEQTAARDIIVEWRERLASISWFMGGLNQCIACQTNKEDSCKGRFWEGRFKCQALLDEGALLTCMSYVDLNPIRAGIAMTSEASEFTSIAERIQAVLCAESNEAVTPLALLAFVGTERHDQPKGIPFRLMDYLQLVDWTSRAIRDDKRCAIPQGLATILKRLNIDLEDWTERVSHFGRHCRTAIGSYTKCQVYSEAIGKAWVWGG